MIWIYCIHGRSDKDVKVIYHVPHYPNRREQQYISSLAIENMILTTKKGKNELSHLEKTLFFGRALGVIGDCMYKENRKYQFINFSCTVMNQAGLEMNLLLVLF